MAVLVGGALLAYFVFRTSLGSPVRDQQIGANASAFKPFVDKWHVHGSLLTISANGTGTESWNAGPCFDLNTDPNAPMCEGNADMVFTANSDGTITGKLTRVWYTQWNGAPAPAGYAPDPSDPRTGDMFTLRQIKPHLLRETPLNRPDYDAGGNWYWCGSQYFDRVCGD